MGQETNLHLRITPSSNGYTADICDLLRQELGGRAKISASGQSDIPVVTVDAYCYVDTEMNSSSIPYFSEVEGLLSRIENISPGLTCNGTWEVDDSFGPPDQWEFERAEGRVSEAADAVRRDKHAAKLNREWDKVLSRSKTLDYPSIAGYMMMPPKEALRKIQREGPDKPCGDDGIACGKVVMQRRGLGSRFPPLVPRYPHNRATSRENSPPRIPPRDYLADR